MSENLQKTLAVVIVILAVGGFVWYQNTSGVNTDREDSVVCPADAKECPDGSFVGRVGPDCEFAACPSEEGEFEEGDGEEVNNNDTVKESEIVAHEALTWTTYTNNEWKFSFEYPEIYTLTEELNGVKITVSPPEGEFNGPSEWFMVWVVQYPSDELLGDKTLNEYLFYRANLPNGEVAWLKDEKFYAYEDYFIARDEVVFGQNPDREAIKVRETSINPELGEYRSIVYVLRDPVIYRVTHDLLAEQTHSDILDRVENSFTVLE